MPALSWRSCPVCKRATDAQNAVCGMCYQNLDPEIRSKLSAAKRRLAANPSDAAAKISWAAAGLSAQENVRAKRGHDRRLMFAWGSSTYE